jgi:hypothetical protein
MLHSPRARELYNSPNGDRWLLARESESGRVFIRHVPNVPSGGKEVDIEIGAFLCERSYGPQHIELLRLIGTLVENSSAAGGRDGSS